MKKTTKKIIDNFPKLHAYVSLENLDDSDFQLDDIQLTFLKLIRFFENPNKESFDLQLLYTHLDNDWLEFALELIVEYFREDTFLIRDPSFSLIRDGSDYFGLSKFADYLANHGLPYSRQKLNLYYSRGSVPKPDLIVGGIKYWSKETVQLYKEQEETRLQTKEC